MSSEGMKSHDLRIVSKELTTCGSCDGGQSMFLNFIESSGTTVSIEMPFDQAASLAMTVPHLLSSALKLQTRNPMARYVFPVSSWSLETSENSASRIFTLQTPDGFGVSFVVPLAMCDEMGESLAHLADFTQKSRCHS